MPHADRKLVRPRIRREISYLIRVEHHHVCSGPRAQHAAIDQAEILCRQTRESPDGFLKR
jgi:hypothetical protein